MGASLGYPRLKVQKEIFRAAKYEGQWRFWHENTIHEKNGDIWSISDANIRHWHPVQRLEFKPSGIQGNLKRAEEGILLFVYEVPVFCMSSMGGVSA